MGREVRRGQEGEKGEREWGRKSGMLIGGELLVFLGT